MQYFTDTALDDDFSAVEEMWIETRYFPGPGEDSDDRAREHGWTVRYEFEAEALALVRHGHETFGQAAAGIDGGAKPGRLQMEWNHEVPADGELVLQLLIRIDNNSDGIARIDFQPVAKWHGPLAVAHRDRRMTLLFDRDDGVTRVKTRLALRELPTSGLDEVVRHLNEVWEMGPVSYTHLTLPTTPYV